MITKPLRGPRVWITSFSYMHHYHSLNQKENGKFRSSVPFLIFGHADTHKFEWFSVRSYWSYFSVVVGVGYINNTSSKLCIWESTIFSGSCYKCQNHVWTYCQDWFSIIFDHPSISSPSDQYAGDHQGNGNLNNGNNNWQDSLFLFVAIFFFFWLLSVWWSLGTDGRMSGSTTGREEHKKNTTQLSHI